VQYKATLPGFSLNFAGADEAAAFIYAQSKELLNSAWTVTQSPRVARLKSPTPPPTPTCDTIVWATLPDALGVSRVHLRWSSNGAPPSASFHIYEATETGLLDVGGMPPADLSAPYATRLATLRTLDLATCRKTFRKLTLPVAPYTQTDFEVELPRGGRILYAYVVTAVSANNIESAFPADASIFTAVAVPFVEVPRPPRLSAILTQSGGVFEAVVKVESRVGVSPDRFVLYRTGREGLSRSIDLMGPPLSDSTQTGWVNSTPDPTDDTWNGVFTDAGVTGSWLPTWAPSADAPPPAAPSVSSFRRPILPRSRSSPPSKTTQPTRRHSSPSSPALPLPPRRLAITSSTSLSKIPPSPAPEP
jgi:hypothetical protein